MMEHVCGNRETLTSRLVLALLSDDEDSYRFVMNEMCPHCWEFVAHWAVSLVAGAQALQAGGREAAAEFIVSDLARVMSFETKQLNEQNKNGEYEN
jgi:hypothetical protein